MSKRKSTFARDLRPGDVIRLVYEIEVNEIGDLDTKFPSASLDMLFINGTIVKGPMRKSTGDFAIYGEDKLTVIHRKGFFAKVRERLSGWGLPTTANTSDLKPVTTAAGH